MTSQDGAEAVLKAGRFFFEQRAVHVLSVSINLFETTWGTFKKRLLCPASLTPPS